MSKWDIEISGKVLRRLTLKKNTMGVLQELVRMTSYLISSYDLYYSTDFEDLLEELKNDLELGEKDLLDFITSEANYDNLLQYGDAMLDWFYDLCDRERVWVSL